MNMTGTGIIIIIAGIMLLCWEVVAFVRRDRRSLISTWVQKFGFRAPASMFVLGMLAGHFWTYFPPTLDDETVKCPRCDQVMRLRLMDDGTLVGEIENDTH